MRFLPIFAVRFQESCRSSQLPLVLYNGTSANKSHTTSKGEVKNLNRQNRIITIGFIILLLTTIIAAASALYFYQEIQAIQQNYTTLRESVFYINITLNYDNGTVEIYDAVYVAPKQTVFDALKTIADVNATYWDAYGSWLIDAINGVVSNANGNNRYWVYSVNGEHATLSADAYELSDGDQIEWIYYQY